MPERHHRLWRERVDYQRSGLIPKNDMPDSASIAECSGVAINVPVAGMASRVNGIMLVDNINGLSLEGEFDVDSAFAVVGRQEDGSLHGFHLTCIAVL